MDGRQTWPAMSLAEAEGRLTAPGARFEMDEVSVRGVPVRVWKHVPATARALFDGLDGFADRECLVLGAERVTYDGFGRAVTVLAAMLAAEGVRKGDRVALVMRNLPEWPVIFLAGLLAGAILVPLNAHWTAAELAFALRDCGARLVFADGERLERVRQAAPGARVIASRAGSAPDGAVALEAIIGAPADWAALPRAALPPVAPAPEDDATIFYTSGTTADPKGALGTHRNLTTNIFATAFSNARNLLRSGAPAAPATRRVILIAIPFFHVTASLSALLPTLAAGGKIVLMRKFEPGAALALIQQERVTITGGVPSVALALLGHPDFARADLSSLELLSYGGAPSPALLPGRIAEGLAAAPGNAWGMTETSATCTIHSGADYLARPQSCGPVLPVGAIKVMAQGRALPPGEVGELWAFGPNVVKGYWNRPGESAAAFQDGWVKTGDLARIDAEGFCTILDRARDMVIRGGENIYCIEVEQVLAAHPKVTEAALVGLAHDLLGEVPAAVVQASASLDEAELRAFAAARLAAFKLPVKFWIREAPLPRNESGKVMKAQLRAALSC